MVENRDILFEKEKYIEFRKKLKILKFIFKKETLSINIQMFIYKFNSRYILVIGDDDRINTKNFNKIFKHLNSDFSGITTSFTNFKEDKDLRVYKIKNLLIKLRSFDLSTRI